MSRDNSEAALVEAMIELSGELTLDVLLARAMDVISRLVEADRSSLFIFDSERNELWSKIAQGLDSHELRFSAGAGLAGLCIATGGILNVPDAYEHPRFNRDFDTRTGYRTRSVLCVPMRDGKGEMLGLIQTLNKSGGRAFGPGDERALTLLGGHVGRMIENARLHESIERLFEDFVRAITKAVDERDAATAGHTRRVAVYSVNLARALHEEGIETFSRPRLRQLRYAALLHDVGKIGVRESVLSKEEKLPSGRLALVIERLRRIEAERGQPGCMEDEAAFIRRVNGPCRLETRDIDRIARLEAEGCIEPKEAAALRIARGTLTPDEWDDMRSHARRGLAIMEQIAWPADIARVPDIAVRHHEKLDGSGYPEGMGGEGIDLDARILQVADIYDALTAQDRPYKPAIPHERAAAILREEAAAGKLDGRLVELFLRRELHQVILGGDTRTITQAG